MEIVYRSLIHSKRNLPCLYKGTPSLASDDDDAETDFASDLDSMRHPVLDRITGNTPSASPISALDNTNNNQPIYNNSYLEATSISFREGLRPPSSAAASRSSTDRSFGEPATRESDKKDSVGQIIRANQFMELSCYNALSCITSCLLNMLHKP